MIACTFRCYVSLATADHPGITVQFRRTKVLPFVPQIGLQIGSGSSFGSDIEAIFEYHLETNMLNCRLGDLKLNDTEDFLEIFDDLISCEWTAAICFTHRKDDALDVLGADRVAQLELAPIPIARRAEFDGWTDGDE